MFGGLMKFSVRAIERWMPDPLIFAFILTIIAALAAIVNTGYSTVEVVGFWGDSIWGLLAFSMQMVLIVVTGYILSTTPLFSTLLNRVAAQATTPARAILLVTISTLVASWLNWGLGLIVGAMLARRVATRLATIDYRLLVSSAYSGWIVYHGGLSSSIGLTIATPGHFLADQIGLIPTSETLFTTYNLAIVAGMFIVVPLMNLLMLRGIDKPVCIDPARLAESQEITENSDRNTLAEKLENSWMLSLAIGGTLLAYAAVSLAVGRTGLNINVVNLIFLSAGIVLHGTPARFLRALNEGVRYGGPIIIQFPFYAGIMGIMSQSGLSNQLSQLFIEISTAQTLPLWTFLSAGVLNVFIPSGGGQWAVQGPIVMEAAQTLGADLPRVAMAVAWGDAWTNLIQPFWALPILAIAGLRARDIMGFCLMQIFATGLVVILGLMLI